MVACWLVNSSAKAQIVYSNASTVGESYAKGLSDVITAQGNYNLATSEAAIKMEDAIRRDIENQQLWTDTYFEMRKSNRAYRAEERGRRPTTEDAIRYAQMGKPIRLSPSEFDYVTGKISWPKLLEQKLFDEERTKLDELFVKRAKYGGVSFDEQTTILQSTNNMMDQLKEQIHDMPAMFYMVARRFLESLAYESQLPPHG